MTIILASSNAGKLREFKDFLKDFEVRNYSEFIAPFEIEENGADFKENALIKARAVYKALKSQNPKALKNAIILSDDSGISVKALDGAPGIYSARYSCDLVEHPTEASNRAKLKSELDKKGVFSSPAFYTAAIAAISDIGGFSECVELGFMHGSAIADERGENGFGYDFMFIPQGYELTIGQLSAQIKEALSHRTQALRAILPHLKALAKG
ncbi:non-canonical purine NTP pyrophosphatase [Campylobacter sp.]|uniref:non-canonical purine NTP pyrophosphatase n=1 Tax=Campylobacter sp. TaxID=205 RepID=UPI002A6467A5|nr:non-canonical purine NTP pyrophosphatase [Campylobacter sp.]MDD7703315.1 non-canonical purine NTP pyrophosphatase [Campylobacteraceae bacterium]MDY2634897.1 non-canonical purine NTP pyrophosphatase [Campylobacter sp.]